MNPEQRARVNWRVENWARWAGGSDGSGATGRCGSAEGRYVREALDEDARAELSRGELDVMDAEEVEQTLSERDQWGNPLIYPGYRTFFVLWHIKRWQKDVIARELCIDRSMVDGFRESALRRLNEVLALVSERGSIRQRNKRASRKGMGRAESLPTTSRVSSTEH